MDADPECVRKLLLSQARESSKRDDILSPRELSAEYAFALFPRHRTSEVLLGQFTNLIFHVSGSHSNRMAHGEYTPMTE